MPIVCSASSACLLVGTCRLCCAFSEQGQVEVEPLGRATLAHKIGGAFANFALGIQRWDLCDFLCTLYKAGSQMGTLFEQLVCGVAALTEQRALPATTVPRNQRGHRNLKASVRMGRFGRGEQTRYLKRTIAKKDYDHEIVQYIFATRRHMSASDPRVLLFASDGSRVGKKPCWSGLIGLPSGAVAWCTPQVARGRDDKQDMWVTEMSDGPAKTAPTQNHPRTLVDTSAEPKDGQ